MACTVIRTLLVLYAILVFAAPSLAETQLPSELQSEAVPPRLYMLSFNGDGDLTSPLELELAISELLRSQIERVVIVSYGWAYDQDSSYTAYRRFVEDIFDASGGNMAGANVAIVGVGWDSSLTGVRKLLNDVLPFPMLADAIAWLPDQLLLPASFWSKAALADRIAYGGLRSTLNALFSRAYPDPERQPEIFLLGHSFGARIVSGLMKQRVGFVQVRSDPFAAAGRVRGAVLLQPALNQMNLHQDAEYPILITQSQHDHALGAMFPVANVVINAYAFTMFEALVEDRVFGYLREAVATTAESIGGALPSRTDGAAPAEADRAEKSSLPSRALYRARRTAAELVSIPCAFAYTIVQTPFTYAMEQGAELVRNPLDHVMDTLAQIPVVEIPVEALSALLRREVPWGQRSKGFLNLGVMNESVGRVVVPRPFSSTPPPPVYSALELFEIVRAGEGCGLPRCSGAFVIDATPLIRTGGFGQDMENPLFDFTVGWIDPVGAHGDYRNTRVVWMIGAVADNAKWREILRQLPDDPEERRRVLSGN
jgi:hypothetical protein